MRDAQWMFPGYRQIRVSSLETLREEPLFRVNWTTFAGVVNAEEETTEKRYGRTDGRILLTYEDEDGNSYEETSDIVLTIQPLKIEEKNTDKNEEESNKIGRQFLIGVTAVVGLGIVGVVLPGWIRRRKQGQFYE